MTNNFHYRINICWSEEDNRYLAEMPDFQSRPWADGNTYESCLSMAKEVINEWIQICKEEGQFLPKPNLSEFKTKEKVFA